MNSDREVWRLRHGSPATPAQFRGVASVAWRHLLAPHLQPLPFVLPSGAHPALASIVASSPTRSWLGALHRRLSLQDRLCVAYHVFMTGRVLLAPASPGALVAQLFSVTLLTVTLAVILLRRASTRPPSTPRAVVYRFGVLASMILSYFELGVLLPSLQPQLLDGVLLRIDRLLFGETPALLLARIATPAVVEWFAFFYFSYFLLLGTVLLPSLFFLRSPAAAQLQLGAVVVACVGHATYTFVPGVGPYAAMSFPTALEGGFWWQMVLGAVGGGGAMLDIFPSLHTAYPTFFALVAFRHRRAPGFRRAWPLLAFFALNIVISTMLLRWHYGIDVVFGLLLAGLAERISRVAAPRPRLDER